MVREYSRQRRVRTSCCACHRRHRMRRAQAERAALARVCAPRASAPPPVSPVAQAARRPLRLRLRLSLRLRLRVPRAAAAPWRICSWRAFVRTRLGSARARRCGRVAGARTRAASTRRSRARAPPDPPSASRRPDSPDARRSGSATCRYRYRCTSTSRHTSKHTYTKNQMYCTRTRIIYCTAVK